MELAEKSSLPSGVILDLEIWRGYWEAGHAFVTISCIYLASSSPRRRELLLQLQVSHIPIEVEIDETPMSGEAAEGFVTRMALEKARTAVSSLPQRDLPVLAADTDVVLDGEILGKPHDEEDEVRLLSRLSGRSHKVFSAVALIWKEEKVLLSESVVWFRHLDEREIRAYWRTGEPVGKAGGYGIQGAGAVFIERIEGSYSGVVGLPLFETAGLLREVGLSLL